MGDKTGLKAYVLLIGKETENGRGVRQEKALNDSGCAGVWTSLRIQGTPKAVLKEGAKSVLNGGTPTGHGKGPDYEENGASQKNKDCVRALASLKRKKTNYAAQQYVGGIEKGGAAALKSASNDRPVTAGIRAKRKTRGRAKQQRNCVRG